MPELLTVFVRSPATSLSSLPQRQIAVQAQIQRCTHISLTENLNLPVVLCYNVLLNNYYLQKNTFLRRRTKCITFFYSRKRLKTHTNSTKKQLSETNPQYFPLLETSKWRRAVCSNKLLSNKCVNKGVHCSENTSRLNSVTSPVDFSFSTLSANPRCRKYHYYFSLQVNDTYFLY